MSSAAAPGPEAGEVAPGIHRLPIPTPFLVGRVNLYLLDGPPLTLVDTGPNSGKSLDELEQGLAALGRRIEELELIVLTHQHVDHTGLLEVLVRRSGAEVAGLDLLAGYLLDYPASAAADDEFAQAVMLRHGVPPDTVTVLGVVSAAYRAYGSAGMVTRRLAPGDALAVGSRRFTVLHRPGHSPTDTVFLDSASGVMIGGDHLLARISSNPLISRPPDATAGPGGQWPQRPQALLDYIASLRATRELDVRLVLPGHGETVSEHAALIDERLRMHERRARRILRMLVSEGPLSAYEIALRMWGNIAVTQAYLTLSEVVGHLDLLLADGDVEELEADATVRFAATAGAEAQPG